jgi:nitrogen regulatory protein P-II 1
MKEINIVIPNARLQDVNQVLYKHKVGGLSYYNISGRGGQHEEREVTSYEGYRTGKTVIPEFEQRTKVEVVVPDSRVKEIIDDVISTLRTGPAGPPDGKVFVKDIPEVYDIRSEKTGESAI